MTVRLLKSSVHTYENANKAFYEKIKEKYIGNEINYFAEAALIFLLGNQKSEQEKIEEQHRLKVFLQNLFYYWQYTFQNNQSDIHSYILNKGLKLSLQEGLERLTDYEKKVFRLECEICRELLNGKNISKEYISKSIFFSEWEQQDSWEESSKNLIKERLQEFSQSPGFRKANFIKNKDYKNNNLKNINSKQNTFLNQLSWKKIYLSKKIQEQSLQILRQAFNDVPKKMEIRKDKDGRNVFQETSLPWDFFLESHFERTKEYSQGFGIEGFGIEEFDKNEVSYELYHQLNRIIHKQMINNEEAEDIVRKIEKNVKLITEQHLLNEKLFPEKILEKYVPRITKQKQAEAKLLNKIERILLQEETHQTTEELQQKERLLRETKQLLFKKETHQTAEEMQQKELLLKKLEQVLLQNKTTQSSEVLQQKETLLKETEQLLFKNETTQSSETLQQKEMLLKETEQLLFENGTTQSSETLQQKEMLLKKLEQLLLQKKISATTEDLQSKEKWLRETKQLLSKGNVRTEIGNLQSEDLLEETEYFMEEQYANLHRKLQHIIQTHGEVSSVFEFLQVVKNTAEEYLSKELTPKQEAELEKQLRPFIQQKQMEASLGVKTALLGELNPQISTLGEKISFGNIMLGDQNRQISKEGLSIYEKSSIRWQVVSKQIARKVGKKYLIRTTKQKQAEAKLLKETERILLQEETYQTTEDMQQKEMLLREAKQLLFKKETHQTAEEMQQKEMLLKKIEQVLLQNKTTQSSEILQQKEMLLKETEQLLFENETTQSSETLQQKETLLKKLERFLQQNETPQTRDKVQSKGPKQLLLKGEIHTNIGKQQEGPLEATEYFMEEQYANLHRKLQHIIQTHGEVSSVFEFLQVVKNTAEEYLSKELTPKQEAELEKQLRPFIQQKQMEAPFGVKTALLGELNPQISTLGEKISFRNITLGDQNQQIGKEGLSIYEKSNIRWQITSKQSARKVGKKYLIRTTKQKQAEAKLLKETERILLQEEISQTIEEMQQKEMLLREAKQLLFKKETHQTAEEMQQKEMLLKKIEQVLLQNKTTQSSEVLQQKETLLKEMKQLLFENETTQSSEMLQQKETLLKEAKQLLFEKKTTQSSEALQQKEMLLKELKKFFLQKEILQTSKELERKEAFLKKPERFLQQNETPQTRDKVQPKETKQLLSKGNVRTEIGNLQSEDLLEETEYFMEEQYANLHRKLQHIIQTHGEVSGVSEFLQVVKNTAEEYLSKELTPKQEAELEKQLRPFIQQKQMEAPFGVKTVLLGELNPQISTLGEKISFGNIILRDQNRQIRKERLSVYEKSNIRWQIASKQIAKRVGRKHLIPIMKKQQTKRMFLKETEQTVHIAEKILSKKDFAYTDEENTYGTEVLLWKGQSAKLLHKSSGYENEKKVSVKPQMEEIVEMHTITQNVKKEVSVSKKSLKQQENSINGIQKELKAQRKMIEDAMTQFKTFEKKEVSVKDLTNKVMKEMQKQFRLEKVRRGF